MILSLFRLLAALLLVSAAAGCRTGKPDARLNAELQAPAVGLDTSGNAIERPQRNLTQYNAKASLVNRATDAIGLSTKEGRARRQARKDAKAAVPRSIGKGAVYAVNSDVTNGGNKPRGPVTKADSGATVSNAAENSQQQNVQGNDNDLDAKQANPQTEAPGPLAVLADNLTAWVPYVAAGLVVLLLLWLWRKKKQAETLIP